uniref:Nucleoplasmin core domain-containing protein n=1 Tax=Cyprinus carpio TaxID=7962 RepID=A0A8C2AJ49_CYPCA
MTNCFIENDSVASVSLSELSNSSSVSDRACVHWGERLSCVREPDNLQHIHSLQLLSPETLSTYTYTCLHRHMSDFVVLQISFPGLELIPPVTFKLCFGKGPVYISAQHVRCKSLHWNTYILFYVMLIIKCILIS